MRVDPVAVYKLNWVAARNSFFSQRLFFSPLTHPRKPQSATFANEEHVRSGVSQHPDYRGHLPIPVRVHQTSTSPRCGGENYA